MKNNGTGLSQQELDLIKSSVYSNPKVMKAMIYGSRATGKYKINSDVDIAVKGIDSSLEIEELRLALDELPLPYKFDLVSVSMIRNISLKNDILNHHTEL